jgi:hypothetical protein
MLCQSTPGNSVIGRCPKKFCTDRITGDSLGLTIFGRSRSGSLAIQIRIPIGSGSGQLSVHHA